MKKRMIIIILAVLIIAAISIYSIVIPRFALARPRELLRHVGVENKMKLELLDYTYWKDVLGYVSGYEMAVLQVDPEKWTMPSGWHSGEMSMGQIGEIHQKLVDNSMLREHELDILDSTFQEWFYTETDREVFSDWEYYIGLYREDGLLVVYRGHDLSSELYLL